MVERKQPAVATDWPRRDTVIRSLGVGGWEKYSAEDTKMGGKRAEDRAAALTNDKEGAVAVSRKRGGLQRESPEHHDIYEIGLKAA